MKIAVKIALALLLLFALTGAGGIGASAQAAPAHHGSDAGLPDGGDHAAAAGHEKTSGLPQLDPTWFASQIFWLVVTFGLLYLIFSRKILPDLGGVIETRRASVQDNLDRAESLKTEAEGLQKDYEDALALAHQRSAQLFAALERDIKTQTAKKIAELRAVSERETQKTETAIGQAKKDAMEEMSAIAAEIASLAAEKTVGLSADIDQARSIVRDIYKKAA